MNNMLPPDQNAREKIAQEVDKNILVEAGAGSGKTTSLVERMLNTILTGQIKASQIAAITFTRKAAAELKERFQSQLERKYGTTTDPLLKSRLEEALADLDQCFLGTIHSFCAKLLKERPVEAGLDPQFKELDEIENRLILDQVWNDYLLEVKLHKPQLLEKLRELDMAPGDLKESFGRLSNFPEVEKVYGAVDMPELRPTFDSLVSLAKKAKKAIPPPTAVKDYDKLQEAILKALRYIQYFDMQKQENVVKVLKLFDKDLGVTQNRWVSRTEAIQYRDEFSSLYHSEIKGLMEAWREYCHYHIMSFLLPAVDYLEARRRELSYLNFQDLLMKTSLMLKNYPEVREYFQAKYKTLLIDEFQDTDPIQSEIMFYLTGNDTQEKQWFNLIPKPGSLFVVGDPKQSIYRFRRADIDTYNMVKELILNSGGEVLELTTNFRSLNSLGEWFNPTFHKLLPTQSTTYQAGFSALDTLRPDEDDKFSGVKVVDIPDSYTKKEEIVGAEAQYISSYIHWALQGNIKIARSASEVQEGISVTPRPKDFMILLRYKDSMDVYARALESYGIPVKMTGGSSLKDSQEMGELLKVLQALSDLDDQVALVAAIRGMFFGISDDSLYKFKVVGGIFNIFSPIPEELDGESQKIISPTFAKLQEYYQWTQSFTPTVALEKIIEDLGLIPLILQGDMGKSGCGYVYQALEKLRSLENDRAYTFPLLVESLAALLDADFEEELNILADEEDMVRIMNLHKAKGLEAPIVFLAHPYKNVEREPEDHIKRINDLPQGYFSFSRSKGFNHKEVLGQPQDWEGYCAEEEKYQRAEETRLLYVAATRAKNLLVISRSLKDKEMKKNPWAPLLAEALNKETLEIPALAGNITLVELPQGAEVTLEDLEKVSNQHQNKILSLSKPTYWVTSPSNLNVVADHPQVKRVGGGGMDWGHVVHKVLESIVQGFKDLDSLIPLILEENHQPQERIGEIKELVAQFLTTDLWEQLQRAQEKYTEVPFSLKIDKDHGLYELVKGDEDGPVYLSGVIDLVYKDSQGWIIVDYKSDRPEKDEDYKVLEEIYSNQVKIYCHIWSELTGEQVSRGDVYFTSRFTSATVYPNS